MVRWVEEGGALLCFMFAMWGWRRKDGLEPPGRAHECKRKPDLQINKGTAEFQSRTGLTFFHGVSRLVTAGLAKTTRHSFHSFLLMDNNTLSYNYL